jgi:hypothetical protein
MRATPGFALLTLATATVLAGSYLWAWNTETFWRPLPLYPCVLTAGGLALLAIYVNPDNSCGPAGSAPALRS